MHGGVWLAGYPALALMQQRREHGGVRVGVIGVQGNDWGRVGVGPLGSRV